MPHFSYRGLIGILAAALLSNPKMASGRTAFVSSRTPYFLWMLYDSTLNVIIKNWVPVQGRTRRCGMYTHIYRYIYIHTPHTFVAVYKMYLYVCIYIYMSSLHYKYKQITHIRTYLRTYVRTYVRTYIHSYIHRQIDG